MESSKRGVTNNGPYKSWAERQIALFLERNEILYQYEYPLAVIDDGKTRIYYPDFRLPQYGLIMEYFGLAGNPDYDERTRHKLGVYQQAGIEGIFLNRESFRGDWPGQLLRQIEDRLETRLWDFHIHQKNVETYQQSDVFNQTYRR